MNVALVDFTAEYDGGFVHLKAGRDEVADGHELHRRFPEKFGPAPTSHGRARRRPAGLRRDGGSSVAPSPAGRSNTVRFTEDAWDSLREEVAECDGLEVGGGMFGDLEQDGSVLVHAILGPNEWTERSRFKITMDREYFLRHEAALHPWKLVGDWHSHDEAVAKPSESDERGWAAFTRADVGVYVGVIATPRDVTDWRWSSPTIKAWVNRVEGGVPRCESARIELVERS